MSYPALEIRPLRSSACVDAPITLDVLLKILPPPVPAPSTRPPVHLGLVLDRSGSMASQGKMQAAREAAIFAIEQLLPTDLVSVTIYDSEVETIVPTTQALDKPGIIARIAEVTPRSSTALFAGWKAGADQVERILLPGGLNRVLLLSDGLANVGVTDPNAIVAAVREAAGRGVATTALGVGKEYNEDLMEAIAAAGHGNYYFIESSVQLTDIFQTELSDLMALVGHHVSLGVEPGVGVVVADQLNDFDTANTGRYKLPNLVAGMPIQVSLRLTVGPRRDPGPGTIAAFRLAWDSAKGGPRQILNASLELPAVPLANWELLDRDGEVLEQAVLLMSARARREAARALEKGDMTGTRDWIDQARGLTAGLGATEAAVADLAAIARLEQDLRAGKDQAFLKRSKQQYYGRRHGKGLS